MQHYYSIYRVSFFIFLLSLFWGCESSKKKTDNTTKTSFSLKKIDEKGISFLWEGAENSTFTVVCLDGNLGTKNYTPKVKDASFTLPYDDFLRNNHFYKIFNTQNDKQSVHFLLNNAEVQARGIDFSLTVDSINTKRAVISWPAQSGASQYYIWLYENGIGLKKDSTSNTQYRYSISTLGTEVFVSTVIGGNSQFSNRMLSNDGGVIVISDEIGALPDCDPGSIPACDSLTMDSTSSNDGCIHLDVALPACIDANAYIIRKVPAGTCSGTPDSLETMTEYIAVPIRGEESVRLIYTIRCLCSKRQYHLSIVPFTSEGLPCHSKEISPHCKNCD